MIEKQVNSLFFDDIINRLLRGIARRGRFFFFGRLCGLGGFGGRCGRVVAFVVFPTEFDEPRDMHEEKACAKQQKKPEDSQPRMRG